MRYLLSSSLLLIILLSASCRKAKYAGEVCTQDCLIIEGKITEGTSSPQAVEGLSIRIFASRSTGVGKSRRLMLQTTTNAQGAYKLSFDASEYVDDFQDYFFELEFKNVRYKSPNTQFSVDNRLESFYNITVDSLDNTITRDYTLIRK